MALPDGAQTITITSSRTHPDGGPMRGRIVVRPAPDIVTNADIGHTVQGDAEGRWIDGELHQGHDGAGPPGITILVADADGYEPTDYTHTVMEYPENARGRVYPVRLTTDLGPEIDLAALAPTARYDGTYVLTPGPRGTAGEDGPPGPSAYNLAVAGGYVGTQAQWIDSLKGETGAPGSLPTGDVPRAIRTAYKPVDEPVGASTVLQPDDHLILPVTAGAHYTIEALILVTGDPTADLTLTITAPPGSTGGWTPTAVTLGTSDGTGSVRLTRFSFGDPSSMGITAAGLIVAPIGGLIAGADGDVRIQWAQAVSSATPTIIRAASWLRLGRGAQ